MMSGTHPIAGWARFIVTQVISDIGGVTRCAVNNPADTRSWSTYCLGSTNPLPPERSSWRVVFGYTSCAIFRGAPPGTIPGPGVSISNRIRLVP
jgi:hypothetical protein